MACLVQLRFRLSATRRGSALPQAPRPSTGSRRRSGHQGRRQEQRASYHVGTSMLRGSTRSRTTPAYQRGRLTAPESKEHQTWADSPSNGDRRQFAAHNWERSGSSPPLCYPDRPARQKEERRQADSPVSPRFGCHGRHGLWPSRTGSRHAENASPRSWRRHLLLFAGIGRPCRNVGFFAGHPQTIAAYASVIRHMNPQMPVWQSRIWRAASSSTPAGGVLDANMLVAIVTVESRWHTHALSHSGAIGLGQLMPGTASTARVDPHSSTAENLSGAAICLRFDAALRDELRSRLRGVQCWDRRRSKSSAAFRRSTRRSVTSSK